MFASLISESLSKMREPFELEEVLSIICKFSPYIYYLENKYFITNEIEFFFRQSLGFFFVFGLV